MQLRSTSQTRLPGEKLVSWTALLISEMALGFVFVVSLLFYAYCTYSDAEWVALPGIISLLLSIGLGFGMVFTGVGFGITAFFANNYFTQRKFFAQSSADYAQFVDRFQPLHQKALRNFGA